MSKHGQKRRTWQALVARFERSGVSQAAFAADAGVGLAAFRYWLYKLRSAAGGRGAAVLRRPPAAEARHGELRLVPVEVRRAPTEIATVEIDILSLRLRVTGSADLGYVASLVGALREAGRC